VASGSGGEEGAKVGRCRFGDDAGMDLMVGQNFHERETSTARQLDVQLIPPIHCIVPSTCLLALSSLGFVSFLSV